MSQPQFRTAGFLQQGYAVGDVDDFLDQATAAIASGGTVPDILTVQFRTARGGYRMDEVDQFLDELAANLTD